MGHDDLNTWSGTGEVMKPIDYQTPWSFLELGIRYAGGITYLACHVPCPAFLRILEDLSPGDRVLVVGELAYVRGDAHPHGGQHCLKTRALYRLDPQGRLLGGDAPALDLRPEDLSPAGNRTRRQRKRRSAPTRQRAHPERRREARCEDHA